MGTRKSPLEDSVENYLVDRVKELGGIALKGDIKGQRFLDRIIILPGGRTVWCECKRPENGRYSKHQQETLKRLGDMGHEVLRVHTKSMVDLFIAHSARDTPPPSTRMTAKCVSCNGVGSRYVRHDSCYGSAATETCADCAGTGKTPSPETKLAGPTNALGIQDGCLVEFRNGETHGPIKHVEGDRFPWQHKKDDHTYKWTEDGKSIVGSQYDIVRVTLLEPMREDETPIVFGLEAQGHIPVIKRLLLEARDWPYIGRAIGWDGATARDYYVRYLERAPSPQTREVGHDA